MQENIHNTSIRVTKDPIMLIKGKIGWQIIIKNIILINKDSKPSKINIFVVDKDDEKQYIERNLLTIPETRLELFDGKGIVLSKKERIFIESVKETQLDVFCNIIEKSIVTQNISVLFTDQHGTDVDDIKYSITDIVDTINENIISFEENEDYLTLEPIQFDIEDTQLNFYKNSVDFNVVSEYGCIVSSDKHTVNLFQSVYASIDNVNSSSSFKVSIAQAGEIWKYKNLKTNEIIIPDNQTDVINLPLDEDYEIQIEQPEGFDTVTYQFKSLRNNFYEFYFDLDHNINVGSSVSITKSDFMSDYDALGVRWRIVGETNTLNYEDVYEGLPTGVYTIEIQKLEGIFDTFTDIINVYDNQRTNYIINNELVKENLFQNSSIYPETVTLAINVIRKPTLSVSFLPSGTEAQWRILYPFGAKSNWNDESDEIKVTFENLQIEFSEVDKLTKPNNYNILLPITTYSKKILAIYTECLVSNLEINFVIPNRYVKYLLWCLVKPDDTQEVFVTNWNNSIYYKELLRNGYYQIKIKEVIFGETIENPVYDFDTGVLIPNQILIEEETIDITLNEDTVVEKILISDSNTE